jgi:hypothetical protein
MKGVVFNLLEEAVTKEYGTEVWEDLIDDAEVSGAYTSLGNYSDEDMMSLVATAAAKLGISPSEVLRWFGNKAMPMLQERYPSLFEGHKSSRTFILSVNSIIHPQVRKLYAGASCPFFHFKEGADGTLMMRYESSRKLCDLAHGFMEGAATIYGEKVAVEHHTCMNHGDGDCQVEIKWVS